MTFDSLALWYCLFLLGAALAGASIEEKAAKMRAAARDLLEAKDRNNKRCEREGPLDQVLPLAAHERGYAFTTTGNEGPVCVARDKNNAAIWIVVGEADFSAPPISQPIEHRPGTGN